MGDPKGIGPEIILKALASRLLPKRVKLLVVGSRAVLMREADSLGRRIELSTVKEPGQVQPAGPGLLDLDNFPPDAVEPRRPDAAAGRASLEYVEAAVRLAMERKVEAVVTCPISKEATAAAGSPLPGHTEMLAHLTGVERPVMMMACPGLRVALVTTHMALRDVPGALSAGAICQTAQVLARDLRRFFGLERARIAVCGLNPHCSDGGRFGDEEARLLTPAVARMRESGLDAVGPKPSDTVFAEALRGRYDAVVALYHDQALIPVKLAGLEQVVNVTLGLPIIRTSVGHGTAYDIAGQGLADERSLLAAIQLAAQMAHASRG
jgi:4-hydroxythreonine-4-phosphate dehydrogenase